jgi:tetratricopeptide (TPR) repeat protein
LAAVVALATGCSSVSSKSGTAANGDSAPVSDWPAEKVTSAHAHFSAAVVHEVSRNQEAALREYYLAALNDPENESLVLDVSRRLLQAKQSDKALEVLKLAASRKSATGAIYARLSLVYAEMGKADLSAQAGRAAIAKAPGSLVGYQNLYVSYVRAKKPKEALGVLDQAARQPHPDPEFFISLSELYANLGLQFPAWRTNANARALAVLNSAAKLKPASVPVCLKLADGFSLMGDQARAAQIYSEVIEKLADLPQVRDRVRAKLADIYLRSEDHTNAVKQLEAIIKENPSDAQATFFLGAIAYQDRKYPEAVDFLRKAILLNPEFEPAYYDLAGAQIASDKPGDALATLDAARKRFAAGFVMEFWTAMAFTRQKAYGQAVQHLTAAEVIAKATETNRLTEAFYFQLGAAHERSGNITEAEKYFTKCLELAPNAPEAMNYLGFMWAEHGTNLVRARGLIEKALRAEPKNGAYLDSMGWVLFKMNQPKAALPWMLKAVAALPEPDATVLDHLGDVYAALDQPAKAREAWAKSVELEANEEVRKKLGSPPGS